MFGLSTVLGSDEDRRFGMELIWSSRTRPSEGATPVLVHGRSDAAGRFTLELPPEVVARRVPPLLAIWTASNGDDRRVASRLLPRIVLTDDPPVRLELASPGAYAGSWSSTRPAHSRHARIIPGRANDRSAARMCWDLRARGGQPMPKGELSSRASCRMRSMCKHPALVFRQ